MYVKFCFNSKRKKSSLTSKTSKGQEETYIKSDDLFAIKENSYL